MNLSSREDEEDRVLRLDLDPLRLELILKPIMKCGWLNVDLLFCYV